MRFTITDVRAEVRGDLGWVHCTENIISETRGSLSITAILATNVFERGPARLAHRPPPRLPHPGAAGSRGRRPPEGARPPRGLPARLGPDRPLGLRHRARAQPDLLPLADDRGHSGRARARLRGRGGHDRRRRADPRLARAGNPDRDPPLLPRERRQHLASPVEDRGIPQPARPVDPDLRLPGLRAERGRSGRRGHVRRRARDERLAPGAGPGAGGLPRRVAGRGGGHAPRDRGPARGARPGGAVRLRAGHGERHRARRRLALPHPLRHARHRRPRRRAAARPPWRRRRGGAAPAGPRGVRGGARAQDVRHDPGRPPQRVPTRSRPTGRRGRRSSPPISGR